MSIPKSLPFQTPQDEPYFHSLNEDWYGRPLASTPSFRIIVGPDFLELAFSAKREPFSAPASNQGDFHEGLWEYDCAELFLTNPDNGHYLELHLAPNGAWWSCYFEEERVQHDIENRPLPGVLTESLEGIAQWETRLRVPLASLPPELAFDLAKTRGNVSFCLGSEPRQTYASWARLPGDQPDYHQPSSFLPLERCQAKQG